MTRKIIENKAQCKKCQDIIESKSTNDLKRCSCGSIAVDGGLDYIKRLGNLDNIIELTKYEGDEIMTGEKIEYCTCEKLERVYTDMDDFGHWDVCDVCGKVVEGTYVYFDHYDGEDHDYDGIND